MNARKIQSYLMEKMGYGASAEGHDRKLISSICCGYYGKPSSVIIEVEGSPVRGRALIQSMADFNNSPSQLFRITIQQSNGRFKTYEKHQYQKDDPNIVSTILNFAISAVLNWQLTLTEGGAK